MDKSEIFYPNSKMIHLANFGIPIVPIEINTLTK